MTQAARASARKNDMAESKRFLILTADAGFGHRSAANAIEAALNERHSGACQVDVVNVLDAERTPAILRDSQTDYDRIARESPDLYKLGYEASDAPVPATIFENALTVMLFGPMRETLERYRPDVIVTTYPLYQAPLAAINALSRQPVPVITVVTDLATVHRIWFNNGVDQCLVPTETVRQLAVECGVALEKVQVTGIPVNPAITRDDREPAEVRRALGWRPELTTVLAVGSKRVGYLPDVLRALNHAALPIQIAAVAGGDDDLHQHLQSVEWHVPAHVHNFVDNMPDLMRASDVIVCKAGGLIVTESLARGLPLLLVDVIPGQEEGNAQYVVDGGAGRQVESPVDALETLFDWLNNDAALLAEAARNARKLGRPNAAYDVAECAWTLAQQTMRDQPEHLAKERPRISDLLKLFNLPWE